MIPAMVIVFAVTGIIAWLAAYAPHPDRRLLFRRVLLVAAIASTIGLIVMGALFFVLMRSGPNSPAGLLPLLLAVPCAVVALPAWLGFLVQAFLTKRQSRPPTS